jgi:nucleotide-binding universal stress UspA family protein
VIQAGKSRVFVGVNGSLASLQALRQAAAEARQRQSELHVVNVRRLSPPVPVGPLGQPVPAQDWGPEHVDRLNAKAMQVIIKSLDEALGGTPIDLNVHCTVLVGSPRKELLLLSERDHDLLVVGTDGCRRWHHLRRRSVSKYCATHSKCPTLIVPAGEFARTLRHRFMPSRSSWPRDPWKEFDATSPRVPRGVR